MSVKSIILNTYDQVGGAAIAAYRLHRGLLQAGVSSQMVVGYKFSSDPTVIKASTDPVGRVIDFVRPALDPWPLTFYPQRTHGTLSFQWLPDRLLSKIDRWQPDIINLHWVGSGFVQIETLTRLKMPICWTLHDMWAFTGGCHYSDGCNRFIVGCGSCPILQSQDLQDVTQRVWQRKQQAWKNIPMTIITPSRWLATVAQSSSLFQQLPVKVIPNGLDTQVYQPMPRAVARQALGLPVDRQLILFGALSATSDRRKGFDLLLAALAQLPEQRREMIELVILGAKQPKNLPNFGFPVHYLGELTQDEQLAKTYAAADVFVLPSREDNLPNTILEALACGTPCVSFAVGGIPEAIDHLQNGYIAPAFETTELARGIDWVLGAEADALQAVARQKALQEYALAVQAQRYQDLYTSLLGNVGSR
jgi:glycosyltransferase involved in cell wall biosynthesis